MVEKKNLLLAVFLAICISVGNARTPQKIWGGEDAYIAELPYQVSLQRTNGNSFCGGTIIDDLHILTAAHCVIVAKTINSDEDILVITGSTDREDRRQDNTFSVIESIVYPNYNISTAALNDIAILKVNRSIPFNDLQQPARLPIQDVPAGTTLVSSGWGARDFDRRVWQGTNSAKYLKKLQTAVLTNEECQKKYSTPDPNFMNVLNQFVNISGNISAEIRSTHICTLTEEGDTCKGDSGGPVSSNGTVFGITSVGVGCHIGFPAINTRISSYLSWIKSIIGTSTTTKAAIRSSTPELSSSLLDCGTLEHSIVGERRSPQNIIKGQKASIKDFPYAVSLQTTEGQHFCGGTIISNRHILTAAHCIVRAKEVYGHQNFSVIAGIDDKNERAWDNTYSVIEETFHPDYNISEASVNDIAVLKLNRPMPFSDWQQAARLPAEDVPAGTTSVSIGWGFTDLFPSKCSCRYYSKYLHKLETIVGTNQQCEKTISTLHSSVHQVPSQSTNITSMEHNKLHSTEICTLVGRGTVCNGDGGSSLSSNGVVFGIASAAMKCDDGFPALYTRVFSYVPWIKSIIETSVTNEAAIRSSILDFYGIKNETVSR